MLFHKFCITEDFIRDNIYVEYFVGEASSQVNI